MIAARPTKARLAAHPVAAISLLAAVSFADPAAARRGQPDPDEPQSTQVTRPMSTPLLALVSLKDQRVTIYDKDGAILHSPVSSGQTGYDYLGGTGDLSTAPYNLGQLDFPNMTSRPGQTGVDYRQIVFMAAFACPTSSPSGCFR